MPRTWQKRTFSVLAIPTWESIWWVIFRKFQRGVCSLVWWFLCCFSVRWLARVTRLWIQSSPRQRSGRWIPGECDYKILFIIWKIKCRFCICTYPYNFGGTRPSVGDPYPVGPASFWRMLYRTRKISKYFPEYWQLWQLWHWREKLKNNVNWTLPWTKVSKRTSHSLLCVILGVGFESGSESA